MDRDGVRERDFVEFPEIVNDLALVEPDRDLRLDRINLHNLADVAVEHVLVLIVLRLDHFVPGPKLPAEFFHGRLIGTGRVQFILKPDVQFTDAAAKQRSVRSQRRQRVFTNNDAPAV